MEKSAILNADLLDIVFEGRNKEYGAYELRRSYNKRLRISIAVMMLLALLLCIGQLIASRLPDKKLAVLEANDQVLSHVELPNEPAPPPPPVLPPPPVEQVKTIQFTTPDIVDDEEVKKEMPPVEALEQNVQIDVKTQDGVESDKTVAPPTADDGKDIIAEPKKEKEPAFIPIQKESEYPGGTSAWQRFLTRNLRIPQVAIDNRINGTIMVQFMVDKEGNVSNVIVLSGPEELRDEAVRVIKKSGKWTPALQNGSYVPSYKKQPIVIRIEEE